MTSRASWRCKERRYPAPKFPHTQTIEHGLLQLSSVGSKKPQTSSARLFAKSGGSRKAKEVKITSTHNPVKSLLITMDQMLIT